MGCRMQVCVPTQVVEMLNVVWDGKLLEPIQSVAESREHAAKCMGYQREQVLRKDNPIPYKVSLSDTLSKEMHSLWMSEAPIAELI